MYIYIYIHIHDTCTITVSININLLSTLHGNLIIVFAGGDKVKVTTSFVSEEPKVKVTSPVPNVQPEKLKVASPATKAHPKETGPVSDSENEMSVEGSSGD